MSVLEEKEYEEILGIWLSDAGQAFQAAVNETPWQQVRLHALVHKHTQAVMARHQLHPFSNISPPVGLVSDFY